MTITLNHTIVPAVGSEQAAAIFAAIMGLTYAGNLRHIAPVRVNGQLAVTSLPSTTRSGCTWRSTSTRPRSTKSSPG